MDSGSGGGLQLDGGGSGGIGWDGGGGGLRLDRGGGGHHGVIDVIVPIIMVKFIRNTTMVISGGCYFALHKNTMTLGKLQKK